jgi:hypothetical protein
MIHQGLLIAAFVLFAIAAMFQPPKVNIVSIGLALLALSFLFATR